LILRPVGAWSLKLAAAGFTNVLQLLHDCFSVAALNGRRPIRKLLLIEDDDTFGILLAAYFKTARYVTERVGWTAKAGTPSSSTSTCPTRTGLC